MPVTAPLDTTTSVVTPENIAFDYQLAGPFRRVPAYLIDLLVRWGLIVGMVITATFLGFLIDIFSAGPFVLAGAMLTYFVISWFYGTLMETFFNGRTVGKWSCGIRVIDVEGRPISGRRAFVRNLLRIVDMFPLATPGMFVDSEVPPVMLIPTGMVGLLAMILTKRMQRLGDLAAGTMVVVDERNWRLLMAKVDDARVAALVSFLPGDYRVSRGMAKTLAIYAERRHYLTPARRREIARHLTDPLIDRFEFRHDIDPDLLMYALYHKTFLTEGSAESADLGILAGYSPLRKDTSGPLEGMPANEDAPQKDTLQPDALTPSGQDSRAKGAGA